MRKIELSQVYSKFNFAKRFITEYMHKIFQEYLSGEARPAASSVLEVLSSALKGINSALENLDEICETEAQNFFDKKYKSSVFAAIAQSKKDAHWCQTKLSVYPNLPQVSGDKVLFLPAIYYASRANSAAMRKAEIETVKLLRNYENISPMQLPLMQLYINLTNQDEMFFVDKDMDMQFNEIFNIIFCRLENGRLIVSTTKPSNYLKNLKESLNFDFIQNFKDYNNLTLQYDQIAEKYIALASDAWNDAFEKIKSKKLV